MVPPSLRSRQQNSAYQGLCGLGDGCWRCHQQREISFAKRRDWDDEFTQLRTTQLLIYTVICEELEYSVVLNSF